MTLIICEGKKAKTLSVNIVFAVFVWRRCISDERWYIAAVCMQPLCTMHYAYYAATNVIIASNTVPHLSRNNTWGRRWDINIGKVYHNGLTTTTQQQQQQQQQHNKTHKTQIIWKSSKSSSSSLTSVARCLLSMNCQQSSKWTKPALL